MCILFGILNAITVNQKYPDYKCENHMIDEHFELNGLMYQISDFRIYEHNDFTHKYSLVQSDENQVNMVLKMSVINYSSTDQYIPVDEFILESGGWDSNVNVEYFCALNEIENYRIVVNSNDNVELLLPYCYYDLYDDKADIGELSEKKFLLNMYLSYPSKVSVEL